jgi:probable rRNA maturation factor
MGRATIILKRRVRGANEQALERFSSRACKAARLRGWITVLVTGNREIGALNARFRGKKKPTDVLSFPPLAFRDGFAGDIAISAELAAHNARAFGHSPAEEIRILILHGLLHLAGYDHENDRGEMAQKEQELRRRFGLPMSLTERNGPRPAAMVSNPRQRRRTTGRAPRSRV